MTDLDPCLAVIPARGGSKGLPRKNVLPLFGLPLIAHSLRCAALAPRIARTIVSTDDPEIRDIALRFGGDVPFVRPPDLARDDTPMMPVLRHAVAEVERLEQRTYGSVLLLDPTSPGRLPADIARAFALLDADTKADGVKACSKPTFNPFWVGVVERDGCLSPAFPEGARYVRRQDVPAFYRINGALYLWRRSFIESGAEGPTAGRQLLLEIPETRAFSVDDRAEFDLLEAILERGLLKVPWSTRSEP